MLMAWEVETLNHLIKPVDAMGHAMALLSTIHPVECANNAIYKIINSPLSLEIVSASW